MEDEYKAIAEQLDGIKCEDFAIWYMLKKYLVKLEAERDELDNDGVMEIGNQYKRLVIGEQIRWLKMTEDILTYELF